jgi:phage tail sheath protein FI
MPSYKTPGVYVEEVPGALPIATNSETMAAFVGPGPEPAITAGGEPGATAPFRSFAAFTTRYGRAPVGGRQIFWQAVEGYFLEGGTALAVAWAADPGAVAYQAALAALEIVPGVTLVAAPGAVTADDDAAAAIAQALIDHAARTNRFAVLESPPGLDITAIQQWRARFSSDRAALYYPWIRIASASGTPVLQPPSGHVAGIIARTDRERGVWKSPANEVVRSATGLANDVTRGEQDLLNPAAINCIRYFAGKGILVFGARTLTSDPQYKYVSVRRLVSTIQHAIGDALTAGVFEANDAPLWAHVRQMVGNYLTTLWRAGALQGAKPEEACYVRCDRTSMTQDDIDQGRLVCEVGIAPVRPAEFVVLRFSQMTGDGAG